MSLDAMKQALEALEDVTKERGYARGTTLFAITALRAAIEQTKQRKPVAWRKNYQNSGYTYFDERWGTIPDDAEPLFSN